MRRFRYSKLLLQQFSHFSTPQADTMLTIQVGGASGRAGGRGCLSPVELGKRLLVYSRDGDTEEVRNLISRGAPFTTDWVSSSEVVMGSVSFCIQNNSKYVMLDMDKVTSDEILTADVTILNCHIINSLARVPCTWLPRWDTRRLQRCCYEEGYLGTLVPRLTGRPCTLPRRKDILTSWSCC